MSQRLWRATSQLIRYSRCEIHNISGLRVRSGRIYPNSIAVALQLSGWQAVAARLPSHSIASFSSSAALLSSPSSTTMASASAPSHPGGARTYEDAIQLLNTLQSNHTILAAIKQSGLKLNALAIPEMRDWVSRIGYNTSDSLTPLNIIHVAGTKGKGSVCAMTSHILTHTLPSRSKVGLYTSPHLTSVRERIRINNTPISKELFAKYFFEVWDRLEQSAREIGEGEDGMKKKPMYFRYLTLMAFHVYVSEGVDVVVMETGIGGEYDSTNVVEKPLVTGITRLGIDHVTVLGETIEEIAWHKAGIMKDGVKCFVADPQPEGARGIVERRAKEKEGVQIVWVAEETLPEDTKLGLHGSFQQGNAALAVALAKEVVKGLIKQGKIPEIGDLDTPAHLPSSFLSGLKHTIWKGRCQVLLDPITPSSLEWCLDGAHTVDSLQAAAAWFSSRETSEFPQSQGQRERILIFNQQTRDSAQLLHALYSHAPATQDGHQVPFFTRAIFCTNVTYKTTGWKPDLVSVGTSPKDVEELSVQRKLAEEWGSLDGGRAARVVCPTIEEAVEAARSVAAENAEKGGKTVVLVTGSLHLVGGALEVLGGGED